MGEGFSWIPASLRLPQGMLHLLYQDMSLLRVLRHPWLYGAPACWCRCDSWSFPHCKSCFLLHVKVKPEHLCYGLVSHIILWYVIMALLVGFFFQVIGTPGWNQVIWIFVSLATSFARSTSYTWISTWSPMQTATGRISIYFRIDYKVSNSSMSYTVLPTLLQYLIEDPSALPPIRFIDNNKVYFIQKCHDLQFFFTCTLSEHTYENRGGKNLLFSPYCR